MAQAYVGALLHDGVEGKEIISFSQQMVMRQRFSHIVIKNTCRDRFFSRFSQAT